MKTRLIPVLFAGLLAGVVQADYHVMGAGRNYCQKVLENPHRKSGNISWVQGFFSGLNLQRQDDVRIDSDQLWEWINDYCKRNRFESLETAAIALYKELLRRREAQQRDTKLRGYPPRVR
jgi:hypothetical protein